MQNIVENQLHYLLYTVAQYTGNISMCKKQMNKLERHKVDLNKVGLIPSSLLLRLSLVMLYHLLCHQNECCK